MRNRASIHPVPHSHLHSSHKPHTLIHPHRIPALDSRIHRPNYSGQIGYSFELGERGVLHPAFFVGDNSGLTVQTILLFDGRGRKNRAKMPW
jgi:hypothetical protein